MFAELGVEIVDADVLSKQSVEPGSTGLSTLVETFSEDILLTQSKQAVTSTKAEDRQLDRKKLRALIFNDPVAKKKVEEIIHPLVRASIQQALQRPRDSTLSPYRILSSPLLFETKQDQLTDINVVVDISPEEQITRTVKRDASNAQEIKKIVASQLPQKERLEKAQYQIDNSHSIEETRRQVITLHQQFLILAQEKEVKLQSE